MQWNSTLYDQKHDFVAKYGEGLLTFLPENPAQAILDLGCGTGTLTAQLAARGSRVVGGGQRPHHGGTGQSPVPGAGVSGVRRAEPAL